MALPLILGLLGSTLGTGSAIGALGAGALGSGLGRFLETGDFEEGLKTGATSFLGGKVLGSVLGGMGGQAKNVAEGIPKDIPSYGEALNLNPKLLSSGVGADPVKYLGQSNLMGGLQAAASNPITIGQATIGQAMSKPPAMPEDEDIPFENREAMSPPRMRRRQPPPGFRAGYMGELDYGVAPNYNVRYMAEGGLQNVEKADLDNDGKLSSYEKKRGEAIEKSMAGQGKNIGGLVGLLGNEKFRNFIGQMGKTGMGFGLASALATPQARDEYNYMQTGEYTPEMQGMREGGMAEDTGMTEDEEKIIIDAANALMGKLENPDEAIQLFIETFGYAALKDLEMLIATGKMGGKKEGLPGLIEGEGDGMSDSIDAELVEERGREGGRKQPMKIADGEYIVAADAVADIGNGSTDAGAKKLDDLMKKVRMARHGTGKQPPEKDMMAVMKRAIA
jgi:hypothetical protein|tara:strand:+ start:1110 stop:2456 length:1347 start_codon:yes stop_codon:yes gene_type:complete